ncbi:MAG TPA: acetyl-CoA carboxylase biotin carboxylase subunit [Actinomycetota bacterium]|nr:acetyl-CoA carboxylase biotin carboxylase subunit [Actinomycetota bacterium]
MVTKVLVANRGEIAIRIFRACREMGIATVAVYSDIDRNALHVDYADEAYFLGDTAPSASYLNIPRILDVARRSEADGVHPGYGFLAENAGFASAVVEAGLTWIGPPAEAIEAAGDKLSARRIAERAGVPSVPGSKDPISGPEPIAPFAEQHGWPVALKAAKGGGGRGFRVVRSAGEAQGAFESATREAELSFGSSEVYMERYLENPRHIEIQILADQQGNTVYLGERDCSLQRRHQKLLEESPSPVLTPEVRRAMGEAAVSFAREVGYHSAGTVEFLYEEGDEGPRFFFLEMNTRLQVEHPVTELVTGVDLAQAMIRIAEGRPLGFTQDDVTLRGHAIECRINAEDPTSDFLPNPGTIGGYQEPGGPGVRVDAGARAGTVIPASYDSLISKLICYGADRDEAIRRTLRALDEYRIEGLVTTIPFHRLVMASPWFAEGRFSTKTIENELDLSELDAAAAGLAGAGPSTPRRVSLELDGKRFEVRFTELSTFQKKPKPPEASSRSAAGAGDTLTAPMQGTIVKILHAKGDRVKAGEPILVLEAMKMENQIVCHVDGVVTDIKVRPGQTVPVGAELAVVEAV